MASKSITIPSLTASAPAQATQQQADKPKPCCVCKDEKSKRDECMLFAKGTDPSKECKSTIDQYRSCMAGFGFQI